MNNKILNKIKTLCDILGGAFALLCFTGLISKWLALAVAFGFLGVSNLIVAKQFFNEDKRTNAYTSLVIGLLMYVMLAVSLIIYW